MVDEAVLENEVGVIEGGRDTLIDEKSVSTLFNTYKETGGMLSKEGYLTLLYKDNLPKIDMDYANRTRKSAQRLLNPLKIPTSTQIEDCYIILASHRIPGNLKEEFLPREDVDKIGDQVDQVIMREALRLYGTPEQVKKFETQYSHIFNNYRQE